MELNSTGADCSQDSTEQILSQLRTWIELQRISPFVIGDMVNELLRRFGDNAYQILPEHRQLELWSNVCRSIPQEYRNPSKSFTAHEQALKNRPTLDEFLERIGDEIR